MQLPTMRRPTRPVGGYGTWSALAERDLDRRWCLLGAPYSFDAFVEHTPSGGPDAIRGACPHFDMQADRRNDRLWDWNTGLSLDLADLVPIDFGDVSLASPVPIDQLGEALREAARAIAFRNGRPLTLGGEHTISYFLLDGLLRARRDVFVVQFDAHSDRDWLVGRGAELFNGNVMSHIDGLPGVAGIVQVGVRECEMLTADRPKPEIPTGTRMVTGEQFRATDLATVFDGIPDGADVYLTVDVDVLDPSQAPEVAWPVPDGLSVAQLLGAVRYLTRRFSVVGADIVELTSRSAGVNLGALAAAQIIKVLLSDGRLG